MQYWILRILLKPKCVQYTPKNQTYCIISHYDTRLDIPVLYILYIILFKHTRNRVVGILYRLGI